MTRKQAKDAKGFRAFRGFSLAWRKAVIQSTDAQIDALAYRKILEATNDTEGQGHRYHWLDTRHRPGYR